MSNTWRDKQRTQQQKRGRKAIAKQMKRAKLKAQSRAGCRKCGQRKPSSQMAWTTLCLDCRQKLLKVG